ncbi:MAG: hypothetical protein BJ554DRAFT_98 [Olpidium bornovanus]|uniref:Uncharacterized protein n=1 Tax=Olpidium bornovanus TaxID=278681 RepID=A0A8H8A1L8_9FUNG|nr:MAG: hypothetical protein BJ554DRAFT_98 [Olpidium bornovanus]
MAEFAKGVELPDRGGAGERRARHDGVEVRGQAGERRDVLGAGVVRAAVRGQDADRAVEGRGTEGRRRHSDRRAHQGQHDALRVHIRRRRRRPHAPRRRLRDPRDLRRAHLPHRGPGVRAGGHREGREQGPQPRRGLGSGGRGDGAPARMSAVDPRSRKKKKKKKNILFPFLYPPQGSASGAAPVSRGAQVQNFVALFLFLLCLRRF